MKKLTEAGIKLYVVTSKPEVFAKRILEHYGIKQFFEKVIGPDLSEKDSSKAKMVKMAINDTSDAPEISEYVMVGDRFYDIEGAKANGIDSIAVLYGYGNREEFEKAGATHIVNTPEDIARTVI